MEVAAAAAASYVADDVDNLKATELRLGLPGTDEEQEVPPPPAMLPTRPSTPRGKKRVDVSGGGPEEAAAQKRDCAPPAAKAQVVGWPPVRSYRKSCFQQQPAKSKPAPAEEAAVPVAAAASAAGATAGGLFVKVSMDGAPYLRKIDLKMYKGYRELREALEAMFLCFSGGAAAATEAVNPSDFAVTYEDKDGDLMLVGDVPFDMFTSTCKRLRIMKGSEARGLGSAKSN